MTLETRQEVDPELLAQLNTWGEGCTGKEDHGPNQCPHCHQDSGSRDFMERVVGYTTDPPWRADICWDLGAFVWRCTACGGRYWSHIHAMYEIEWAVKSPKWPKQTT